MNILFFGSTTDSVIILDTLTQFPLSRLPFHIAALVTQPPRPVGRRQIISPTPVETFGKVHGIPVHSFASDPTKAWNYLDENDVVQTLASLEYEIVISASYGQKIPAAVLKKALYGGLNVHPSLLPRWRGADPVPWAILAGDSHTGVTVVTVEEQFDTGKIIAQQKVELVSDALPDPTRTNLFTTGTELLINVLQNIDASLAQGVPQDQKASTYASRLKRDDGYFPWEIIEESIQPNCSTTMEQLSNLTAGKAGEAILKKLHKYDPSIVLSTPLTVFLDRAIRALSPWPGVWTQVGWKMENRKWKMDNSKEQGDIKRLKILSAHLDTNNLILDNVQLEGKNPTSWKQFKAAYKDVII